MEQQIENIKKVRLYLLDLVKDLSIEQLNHIPEGFNNNIIWNLAHIVAAQQGLCYVRAGLSPAMEDDLFQAYKSGSKPEGFVDAVKVAHIKHLFIPSLDQLLADYKKNLFIGYVPWNTRYNVELRSIDDAINFLPMHEGLHLGYIMALKRAVGR